MRFEKRKKIIIFSVILIAVICMSIGFSALSNTLIIKSKLNVAPDPSAFSVKFSSSSASVVTNPITPTLSGGATGESATINNSGTPTLENINGVFTKPGDKIVYQFYAINTGEYLSYLTSVILGENTFKTCIAEEGTNQSLVDNVCDSIKVTVQVGSYSTTSTQLGISNHTLAKGTSEKVIITIEYLSSGAIADGPFNVEFGNIYLTYGTTPTSDYPVLPGEVICSAVTSSSLGNVPTGNYTPGDEYTCKVSDSQSYNFYILSTNGNNINLIMNKNIVNSSSWNTNTDWYNSSSEYQTPPYEALSNLNDLTTSWNNISNLNELYTDEGANRYGTISLSGKARLPKFSELSGVGCTVESNSCPRWLTSNMSTDGYWTMSSGVAGYDTGYFNGYTMAPVLTMNKGRNLINRSQLSTTQTSSSTIAIRPVITVAKSNIY